MAEKDLTPPGAEQTGPAPVPGPEAEALAPAGAPTPAAWPTVRQMVGMLVFGLFPLLGVALCVMWGYGPKMPVWKRKLAMAMLILHGAAMVLLLLAMATWVVWQAVTNGII